MSKIIREFKLGRHEFENGRFEDITGGNPYKLLNLWLEEAVAKEELEPNAFTLSTVDSEGQPSSRILYLKDIIDHQLVFYTNYKSQKAQDILGNNKVSLLFFWPKSSRQIRIHGFCTKVAEEVSDAYFASRPRGSKIGAWASEQSAVMDSRAFLEERVKLLEDQFVGDIPRPDFWGGYQIEATYFEFWQGRPSRLHDRLIFEKKEENWKILHKNP